MTLLVDMNLSPRLVEILREAGYDAVHWAIVGDARADDTEILEWARDHGGIGEYLRKGALVTCDEWSSRVRILPIRTESR